MATLEGIFRVREGLSATLKVSDHDRDLSSETVHLYLLSSRDGPRQSVGSATGTAEGVEFTIDVTFDVEPGLYWAEVAVENGEIVYPGDEDRPRVKVVDSYFDNA